MKFLAFAALGLSAINIVNTLTYTSKEGFVYQLPENWEQYPPEAKDFYIKHLKPNRNTIYIPPSPIPV